MTRIVVCLLLVAAAGAAPAAGPAYWDSPERIAFTDGELRGAGLDASGSLVPGLAAETVLADSELQAVCKIVLKDREVLASLDPFGKIPEFKYCAARIEPAVSDAVSW